MSLVLNQRERRHARGYRRMIKHARSRARREGRGLTSFRPLSPPPRSRQIAKAHKAAVAQLFCIATAVRFGVERYGVHVAHLRYSSAAAGARNPGLQRKPDDRWVLPLCPEEHRLQHRMSEVRYWAELGVDPHRLATDLWNGSLDVGQMLEALRDVVGKTTTR